MALRPAGSCRAPDPQQMKNLLDDANGPILELLSRLVQAQEEQNEILAEIRKNVEKVG